MGEKKAVVTGGTGGIGVEVAVELARRGYTITVVGRDRDRGEQAVQRIGGGRFLQADLSVLAEVRAR
jgi:NAD(P)-dependent dehydrogenase (short-subunit alcohol dehydrogenase family)